MDLNEMEAVETRNIDALYESIQLDPYILDKADEIPFVNTRLHEAASIGQTRLAIEIMNLKPSLGKKLNPDGQSPLHLALLNGHSETVKELIKLDKDLIRVKGREMLTPLHYVAETDDHVDILVKFLLACPESIMDLNARGETALHVAVKKGKVRTLEVLMGWIRKVDKKWMIYLGDARGNTILHTAVSTSQLHVVESVARGCKSFKSHVNDKNLEGATAVDIAARLTPGPTRTEIESILRRGRASRSSSLDDDSFVEFLISRETWGEIAHRISHFWQIAMPIEMRNTVLVVATLIATSAFQAVLSPPDGSGGRGGGDNNNLSGTVSYTNANISQINATISASPKSVPHFFPFLFYVANTIAFISSIIMIETVLPFKVLRPLHCSLWFMSLSYWIALPVPSIGGVVGGLLLAISAILAARGVLKRERLRMLDRVLRAIEGLPLNSNKPQLENTI